MTNRDITNTQEITRDQTTGMLDGSVTIDHRLLTKEGRAEIIQEQTKLPENFRQSAENLAQALPDGEYKDKVLQTLNSVQASLANNPEMLAKGGEEVYQGYKEFIRQGGEPEHYEAILNQEVLPLAKELNNLGKQAQDEIKQELTKYYGLDDVRVAKVAKTVLLTRESENNISGSTSVNDSESCTDCLHLEIIKSAPLGSQVLLSNASTYKITLDNGKDIYFETGSNLAIKIFDKSAVVSYKVEEAIKRSGVDPQVAGLAISLALGGPVGLVKDLIIDTVAGDKIVLVSETLKNQVTAVVRESDKEAVSQLTSDELKAKGDAQTLAISEQVQRTKDGVGFLAGVVGIGGIGGASKTIKIDGKDVELSKSGFEIGNENPVTGHKILGIHKDESNNTVGNYIVEGTKPSTKDKIIKTDIQYYENPGHHDPKGGNQVGYNKTKSVLLENHKTLWDNSIIASDGNRWTVEVINGKNVYHRFQNDGNGNFHWNGSTNGKTASGIDRSDISKIPPEILRK